ncbi:class I SAM-dependent methyltransferase [Mesorhizobium sp. M1A.T.Ca.IN.004.03.1.1]|uniref:class I SAM-dependent methyltransferase n=1 Tax=Mesorhizobium sp. M1A.T.Ca.IN.004.03.1.1 TaxID=2496795 RepID=UPI000FCAC03C|nr:class I SAM-dependent methyltransferase [Mesorhizobium sp. M1A.T.Ca.IN.004.03.1.1]
MKNGVDILENLSYDVTGKINLNNIYNSPEPTAYFSTLSRLGYRIPQEAKPRFQRLIEARRNATESEPAKVIDLGCSYGINGALLKHGRSMDELYRLYGAAAADDLEALLQRDRDLYAEPADAALEIVGVDPADRAIAYAVDAGMLDAGVATNLEKSDPTPEDTAAIENADLIISTGCVGYVTETSLERLLETSLDSRPWMAHFVLRMFDFGGPEEMLGRHGYVTEKLEGLFRQRRFASAEERQHVLDNLRRLGIDAAGAEETGWYLAELHVARPEEVAKSMPLGEVLNGSARQIV